MSNPNAGTTAMDQATLSLRLAEIDKALADAAKARAENQRLWEMLPVEIERINAEAALAKAEAERVRENREAELARIKAETDKLTLEARRGKWLYPTMIVVAVLGASAFNTIMTTWVQHYFPSAATTAKP